MSTADTIYREARGAPGDSWLARDLDPGSATLRRRTGELLDQALGDEPMTAAEWDELTANLWALPTVFLHPAGAWDRLAQRLVAEVTIADGLGWALRCEAVNRLLGHPSAELPVIAACAALVADPANQVFIDPLTMLEISPHPDAGRHLIAQILPPTNERAQLGAWCSAAEKIGRGHFGPADLGLLSREAV